MRTAHLLEEEYLATRAQALFDLDRETRSAIAEVHAEVGGLWDML